MCTLSIRIILALLLVGSPLLAHSEEPDLESLKCPIAKLPTPVEYLHEHEVPSIGEGTRIVRTEDGEEMEVPKAASVTDTFTVVSRDAEVLCFGLVTLARN